MHHELQKRILLLRNMTHVTIARYVKNPQQSKNNQTRSVAQSSPIHNSLGVLGSQDALQVGWVYNQKGHPARKKFIYLQLQERKNKLHRT